MDKFRFDSFATCLSKNPIKSQISRLNLKLNQLNMKLRIPPYQIKWRYESVF